MIRARSIFGTIGLLPRRYNLPTITAERLILLLEQFVKTTGQPIDLLLIGALALQCYGFRDRYTNDVDGELTGPLHPLVAFLSAEGVPADLTQDISGWSIVAMPPDLDDALYVVRRFQISRSDIEQAAAAAIAASPEDTALFLFQKTVELFCRQLPEQML